MFGMGGQQITKLNHIPVTQSVQAVTLPIVLGQDRIEMFLLWYGGFKSQNANGKKGGAGKGLGGKGVGYTYTASVVAALCQGPAAGLVGVYAADGKFIQQSVSENYTVPGGGGNYTVANASVFANDAGVGVQTAYSQVVDDFGSPGPVTLSGTFPVPIVRVTSVPGSNQYTVNPSTGVYTFGAAMAGQTVIISYTYYYYYYDTTEVDIVPSTGPYKITVQNQPYFQKDMGVEYYPSGTALTPVSGTPTAAGTYNPNSGNYLFSAADANEAVIISYEWKNTNTEPNAPNTLNFSLFEGSLGQAVWTFLESNYPGDAIAYSQIAYVAFPSMYLGEAGTLPPYTFEVMGRDQFGAGIVDANPADCILDMLISTDAGIGAGSPLTFPIFYLGSLSQAFKCWSANSFFISNAYKNQEDAQSILSGWLEAGQVGAFWSEGVLKFVPYADTSAAGNGSIYVASTQPIVELDDSDFLAGPNEDPVKVTTREWTDRYNRVAIDWVVRANNYNHDILYEEDLAAIQQFGLRQEAPTTYDFIKTQTAAQYAASMRVKRSVYIYQQYSFRLSWIYSYLEPMDLVLINDERLGLAEYPVRIISIEDDPEKGLSITAESFPWGTATASLYNKQTVNPSFPAAGGADPGPVNPPIIFEPPNRVSPPHGSGWVGAIHAGGPGQSGYQLGFGVCGANPANWGGCNVWVSEDGSTYAYAGTISYAARMGVLLADFPVGSDPDTTHTCSVDLSESQGQLTSASDADADGDLTLCLVAGATAGTFELISYSTATLVAGNNYNLTTYIRRGQMTTAIMDHPTGSPFLRIDSNIFYWQYDATMIGKTLYFKFTSFNTMTQMEQSLADVEAYEVVPSGDAIGLLTPANASYRPLSNPLTAIDAGSSATIDIASFTMQIAGQQIAESSGSISGLAYETLYYIYFDDADFFGGAVQYQATTTKEVAVETAGRFFVGSIITPYAGGPETFGNNDGGAGAQTGTVTPLYAAIVATTFSGGSATNVPNANDGNPTTYAQLGGAAGESATLTASGFAGISPAGQTPSLVVVWSVPSITSGSNVTLQYSLNGGATWTPISSDTGAVLPVTTSTVALPSGQNLSQVQVQLIATAGTGASNNVTANFYESWIAIPK